jgi:L-threonylcarbamoyladenylate synthase
MPPDPLPVEAVTAARLDRAAATLTAGGLVAFPTETVYGLGANALDPAAVRRVFAAKGRPADNPLIVHLASADQTGTVAARITPLARQLMAAHWPGPLTLVLRARGDVPTVTTGGLDTVAVRVPDHALARALIQAADVPVAAPSANRSGRPSPTTAAHVLDDLGDVVDVVLDGGPCRIGVESTVVDARGDRPVILREGSVTREQLAIGPDAGRGDVSASPGTRYRHYAPDCHVTIAPAGQGAQVAGALAADGVRVGAVVAGAVPEHVLEVERFHDATQLGALLYRALRAAEDAGLDVLVVEAVSEDGVGRAVMDRLRRAAGGR